LKRRPAVETVRKALVRLGFCRDMTSIDHFRVVRLQRRIRQAARTALGLRGAERPCRFLLRVDDFPAPAARAEDFVRFHQITAEHGLPYLLAVTPFLERGHGRGRLTDHELAILHDCCRNHVRLALHGFTHRSRYRNYPSELVSLPVAALRDELARAEGYLGENGLPVAGFVAPFDAYDPFTLGVLAERYPLLCGGPESVLSLGYRAGPSFLLQSLYVPSYRYAYDVSLADLSHLDRLAGEARGLIVPITMHWPNEVQTNFAALRPLCARLAGHTLSWEELLTWAGEVKALQGTNGADGPNRPVGSREGVG
jgi:hypothetical protein